VYKALDVDGASHG
jgi:hypothetical protein